MVTRLRTGHPRNLLLISATTKCPVRLCGPPALGFP